MRTFSSCRRKGYDVIGSVSTVTARYEDTLVDIARRHGLGYYDVVRANPGCQCLVAGRGHRNHPAQPFCSAAGAAQGLVLNLAEYRMYYFPEPQKASRLTSTPTR